MKVGTENKTKTIIALVLAGLALVFVVRWLFFSDSGSASSERPRPAVAAITAPTAEEPPPQQTARRAGKQRAERTDQKILTAPWKPSLDPTLNLDMLSRSESIKYEGSGRNIFASAAEPEIQKPIAPGMIKPQQALANPIPVANTPPPPPPINLKFYGFASKTGAQKSIFLSQDGTVIVAKEGDIVARRYKIVRINATSIEVLDMLNNNKQTIMLTNG